MALITTQREAAPRGRPPRGTDGKNIGVWMTLEEREMCDVLQKLHGCRTRNELILALIRRAYIRVSFGMVEGLGPLGGQQDDEV